MSEMYKMVAVSLLTSVKVEKGATDEEVFMQAIPGLIRNLVQGGLDNVEFIEDDEFCETDDDVVDLADLDLPDLSPVGDISNPDETNNTGILIVCAGGIVQDVYSKSPIRYALVDYSNIDYSQPLSSEDEVDGGPFDGVRCASLVDGSMVKVFSDNLSGIKAHPSVHEFLADKMEEIGL